MKISPPQSLTALVLSLLLAGCGSKSTFVWNDLTVTNQAVASCNLPTVTSLRVDLDGTVNGVGRLIWSNGQTNLLSGPVHTNFSTDHYSTNCTIAYEPLTSTGGKLKLGITFKKY